MKCLVRGLSARPQRVRCTIGRRSHVLTITAATPASPPGGGTVLDKPGTDVVLGKVKKSIKPPLYKVLLHNDNSNKREYVVKVLLKVVDGLTVDDAVHVMNEAHLQGLALVTVAAQETAEQYVAGLRRNGLTSTLEPDTGCD